MRVSIWTMHTVLFTRYSLSALVRPHTDGGPLVTVYSYYCGVTPTILRIKRYFSRTG